MKSKTKIIVIVVLIVVVIGVAYYYLSSGSSADTANKAQITTWIASAPAAYQSFWNGVLASASSDTLAQWVACLNVFGTQGASLTQAQQLFWNNLSQGH